MSRDGEQASLAVKAATPAGATLGAAKVQVLGLAPLKDRLGPKWEKLSALVHKLFETAIARAQGPYDHFIAVDELSYVVTFSHLSLAETDLACVSIAKEVCRMLFGNQIDEIAVRNIVASIVMPVAADPILLGKQIEAMVEADGTETVVAQSAHANSREPIVAFSAKIEKPAATAPAEIESAHAALGETGLKLGFFPVWELRKGASSSLFLNPFLGGGTVQAAGRVALEGMNEKRVADTEIDLLRAAAAYAVRVQEAGRVCAIGVGVSYGTLSAFHTRIRYITALQGIRTTPSSPILLKFEQIPEGTPVARVAELVGMMKFPNIRVLVEFQSLTAIPQLDIRIGAFSYGGALPQGIDPEFAARIAEKLALRAAAQKGFAFLDRLDSERLVNAANQGGVRFGTGTGLSSRHLRGTEPVPKFPLALSDWS